jgi:hypothetical protein
MKKPKLRKMKTIIKDNKAPFATYTGYTKSKKYRVNIEPIKGNKELEFTSIKNTEDLKPVLDSYIEEVREEKYFHFLIRLNQESKDEICYANYKVSVCFEGTRYLFFPPETVSFYSKKGGYVIEAEAVFQVSMAYTAVWNYDDYPVEIMELMHTITSEDFDENEDWDGNIAMPIFILLICYSPDTDMFDTLPLKLNITFHPKEKIYDSKAAPKSRILQFRNFSESLYCGKLGNEKITKKQ